MPTCNVDGCVDPAVAKLVGEDGYERAYRCRDCLESDLDLRKPRPPGQSALTAKLRERDSLSLTEYSHRLDIHIGLLAAPSVTPEQFANNIESYLDDQFSDLPHAIAAEITERGGEHHAEV